jgi:hypothetical protein
MAIQKLLLKNNMAYDVHLSRLDDKTLEKLASLDDYLYIAKFRVRNTHKAFFGEGNIPSHTPNGIYEITFINYERTSKIEIYSITENDAAEILTVRDLIASYVGASIDDYSSKPEIDHGKLKCELSLENNKVTHENLKEYIGTLQKTFKEFSFVDLAYVAIPGIVLKKSELPKGYINASPSQAHGGW